MIDWFVGKHKMTGLGMWIQVIGMSFIYCRSLTDAHPSLFFPLANFLVLMCLTCLPPTFFHTISIIGHLQHTMIPVQVRCQGCNKLFAPCGLSQHTSKSQNMHCRTIN